MWEAGPEGINTKERKNPQKMKKSYHILSRINEITTPWAELSPETKLGGVSLAEFKTAVAACAQKREALKSLQSTIHATVCERMAADEAARKLIRKVVAGVIADPTMGADSPFYRALKYVPDSERASQLRKAPAVASKAAGSSPSTN